MAVSYCTVTGCDKLGRLKRNMCEMHYQRFMKHGDPNVSKAAIKKTKCEIDGCENTGRMCRGMCVMHYSRFKRHGDPHANPSNPAWLCISSFLEKLPEHNNCVEWQFGRNQNGYGLIKVKGVTQGVHRYVCKMVHGNPPFPNAEASHLCGNRACHNPKHLKWETCLSNDHQKRVHGTCGTKLSKDQVVAIYREKEPLSKISKKYGVSISHVYNIKMGKRWGWATNHKSRDA